MDDRDIIREILDGNIDQFELLVDKYRRSVFMVLGKRIPSQDHEFVAQEVFIKVFRGLSGFDTAKPFENWLVTIAMRTCCDYWRKEKRNRQVSLSSLEEEHNEWIERVGVVKSVDEFESEVSRKETREILDLVMRQLPAEDRILVDLVYFEGWKLKDAAEVLNWQLSKTKVRAMRARNKMREYIKEILN